MWRFLSVVMAGFILALSGCSDSRTGKTENQNNLVIGTSADNPPFEFHDTSRSDQQIQGFDVDLGYALAEAMGLKAEFHDMDFNGLIPALQSGRLQMVIAGFSPTPERSRNVDFSEVYFKVREALVTRAGDKLTAEHDLENKKVGVQLGSTHEQLLKTISQRINGIKIISFNRLGDLIQELRSKRIDAVLTEEAIARAYVGSNMDIDSHILQGHDGEFAIALPKNSPLLPKVNEALATLRTNGKLMQIRNKWFPPQ